MAHPFSIPFEEDGSMEEVGICSKNGACGQAVPEKDQKPSTGNWFSQRPTCGDPVTKPLSDEDLEELKGCIDLGFAFGFEEDHRLCRTLPALNLYYAINRLPLYTGEYGFTVTNSEDDSKMMKMRLKQWAQVVACSIRQYYG
ncbi:uncharacterized protein LOC116246211 isoform X1 [Nymphaea colorata]|nr:uncharacterized protein LOC116246211 isoform X1 [Nymphaea colorata]